MDAPGSLRQRGGCVRQAACRDLRAEQRAESSDTSRGTRHQAGRTGAAALNAVRTAQLDRPGASACPSRSLARTHWHPGVPRAAPEARSALANRGARVHTGAAGGLHTLGTGRAERGAVACCCWTSYSERARLEQLPAARAACTVSGGAGYRCLRVRTGANHRLASTGHLLCGFPGSLPGGRIFGGSERDSNAAPRDDARLVGCGGTMVLTIVPKLEAVDQAVVEHSRTKPQLSARTDLTSRGGEHPSGKILVAARSALFPSENFPVTC